MAFTGGNGAANGGFVYIGLKPLSERKGSSASQVINRLRPKLASMPGATVFLQAGQDLRIGGRQSNAQYQYTIQSDNVQDLVKWGPQLLQQMKKLPGSPTSTATSRISGLQAYAGLRPRRPPRGWESLRSRSTTRFTRPSARRQVSTMYTPLNQYSRGDGGGAAVLAKPRRAERMFTFIQPRVERFR